MDRGSVDHLELEISGKPGSQGKTAVNAHQLKVVSGGWARPCGGGREFILLFKFY